MELRQLEDVVALVDEGQLTRAAGVCGVSQSGLSAAIRTLEDELGTVLFSRTTRSVYLTDAGRALLPHARAALAQAAAGRDAVVLASNTLSGCLRVGAEQCLGLVDVPSLLETFHRSFPLVDITFLQAGSHDLVRMVRGDDLDVAFIATTEHLGPVHVSEIGRRSSVVLVPPGHPLACAGEVSWNELEDREFIDFRETWGVRSLNDAAFGAHGVERRVSFTVDDIHTLIDLVHRGLGIALVPEHVAQKPQASGLVPLNLPEGTAPSWVVSTATAPHADPTAARLLQILAAGDEGADGGRHLVTPPRL